MIDSIKKFFKKIKDDKDHENERLRLIRLINYVVDTLTVNDPCMIFKMSNTEYINYHGQALTNVVGSYTDFHYYYNNEKYRIHLEHIYGIHSTIRNIGLNGDYFKTEHLNLEIPDNCDIEYKKVIEAIYKDIERCKAGKVRNYNLFIQA